MKYLRVIWLLSVFMMLQMATPASAAIAFDGVDDYVDCGNVTNLNSTATSIYTRFTVSTNTDFEYLFVQQNSANTGINGVLFWFPGTSGNGRIAFTGSNSLGANAVFRHSNDGTIAINTEYVAIATWDGGLTATNIHIYVNGTEVGYAVTTNGSGTPSASTGKSVIGARTFDTLRQLSGTVRELAVWNTVISAQNIAILSNSRVRQMPLQIAPANLIAYWALDDSPDGTSGDGDTFRDGKVTFNGTGVDGANNTGLTVNAEAQVSYP